LENLTTREDATLAPRLTFAAVEAPAVTHAVARSVIERLHRGRIPERGDLKRLLRWLCLLLTLAMTSFLSVYVFRHPLDTNDGPVHVAFSHVMMTWHQATQPMQSRAYELALKPNPNLVVYLLMEWIMRLSSPGVAESLVQMLCIAGPVAAGWFALRMITPKNSWLAIFILPMSLNQMLFLGLYNHCIATGVFFLAIGAYYWLIKKPTWWRAVVLAATLVLTYFCHASGFIMASAGICTMAGMTALRGYQRHGRVRDLIVEQKFVLMALVVEVPLVALLLVTGEKSDIAFGLNPYWRLKRFFELHLLSVNYPVYDRFAAVAISLLLLGSTGIFLRHTLKNSRGFSSERRDQALGALLCIGVAFAIVMAFPDKMGGGWTHFRRFEIFPYFFMLLALAFEDFSGRVMGGFMAVAFSVAAFLTGSTMIRQSLIRNQMASLFEADRHIADHCTVLPIALEDQPIVYFEPAWMDYQPFYQSASRLELHGDRVVLFNYLARLRPYPVHFQPKVEPQAEIFHWTPFQMDNHITWIDLDQFEKDSKLAVDYVLVWGRVPLQKMPIQEQVWYTTSRFSMVYRSESGMVTLFQRLDKRNQYCAIGPGTAAAM
jgi:hypothetical protein